MALTKQDITDIRNVVLDALDTVVNPRFDRIEAQLEKHSDILTEHTTILAEHGQILNQHGRGLTAIESGLDSIEGHLQAIEADIKELYALAHHGVPFDKKFANLPPDQKVRKLHAAILTLAKQLHVEL